MDKLNCVSVEDQYKKFPDLDRNEVHKLLDWIQKQPHLPNITELEMIIFYIACECKVEATKVCIDNFYTVRTHCPEFFAKRDVHSKDLAQAMNTITMVPLNGQTPEGYVVLLIRLHITDASQFDFNQAIRLFMFLADMYLLEEGTTSGFVVVLELTGITLGHITRLGLLSMKKLLYYVQEALPVHLRGIYFVNAGPFMEKILALMKPFMKKELMDILQVHNDLNSIYKLIPQSIWPIELGGAGGSEEELRTHWYKRVKNSEEYYVDEEQTRRVNEKLRPGKPRGAEGLFGIEGNFKKLDFD